MTHWLYILWISVGWMIPSRWMNTLAKSWLPYSVAFVWDNNLRKSFAALAPRGEGIIPREEWQMAPRSRLPAVINDWIKGWLPAWPKGDTLRWRAAAFHFLLFSPEAESASPLWPRLYPSPSPFSTHSPSPPPPSLKTVPVLSCRCGELSHLPPCVCVCVCVPVAACVVRCILLQDFYSIPVRNCLVCRPSWYFGMIYSNVLNVLLNRL